MIEADPIARIDRVLQRIEHWLAVAAAVQEFAARGWKLDA
jgi:hypothetical protein